MGVAVEEAAKPIKVNILGLTFRLTVASIRRGLLMSRLLFFEILLLNFFVFCFCSSSPAEQYHLLFTQYLI